ncbi:MAG: M20/M25/M40 family metallo-hydrolase [Planctomycetota bacterium]|nr:M20/M25/M40 family metallo-hydrolase [Planctomycetota bacterium]
MDIRCVTEAITRKFVEIPSPSHSAGEEKMVSELKRIGTDLGWSEVKDVKRSEYDSSKNVYLLLEGESPHTVILFGHHDTVGFSSFAHMVNSGERSLGTDIERLQQILSVPDDYMPGRGSFDMKSGLAAALVAGRLLAARKRGNSVLFASFADEERFSFGAREGAKTLLRIARRYNLKYKAGIYNDICPLDDEGNYPLWAGSVGKVNALLTIFEPLRHAGDSPPDGGTFDTLQKLLSSHDGINITGLWTGQTDGYSNGGALHVRVSLTWTEEGFGNALQKFLDFLSETLDTKVSEFTERFGGLHDTEKLERLSTTRSHHVAVGRLVEEKLVSQGKHAPKAIVSLVAPYYPYAMSSGGLVQDTISIVKEWGEKHSFKPEYKGHFPLVSDMSFLWGMISDTAERELPQRMPHHPVLADFTPVPLGIPCINVGPVGKNAHLVNEMVYAPFTFEVLPAMLADLTQRL